MRRLISLLIVIILSAALATTACAAITAPAVNSFATASSDGSCQVTLTVTLRLDQPVEELMFPVPVEAVGIKLNGSRVSAAKDGAVRQINLRKAVKGVVGDVTVSIHYTLRNTVTFDEQGSGQLELPLLSGFAYTVGAMEFSVTLPGAPEGLPAFSSGYHQANIEKDLSFQVEGATVSGAAVKSLKDHETLTMTVPVSRELFPAETVQVLDPGFLQIAMTVCGVMALLYWLIALFNLPVRPERCMEPPQGFSAGQMGCILALQGTDLPLTVLTWAQLGYLTVEQDRRKRVLLRRRMDMGNERSGFERRWFARLFGKNHTVDTAGYRFATLCREMEKEPAGIRELMQPRSGSGRIFRLLASGIGLFGGAYLGLALGSGAVLQWLLAVLLAVLGGVAAWIIQQWLIGWILGKPVKLITALMLCGIWLILGLSAGIFAVSAWTVAGLLTAGALLFWGGRRTWLGRHTREQVLALRRYLVSADRQTLAAICKEDPDYYFRMAPLATALGVGRKFAARFGKQRFSGCPYLRLPVDANMTALQWNEMLRRVLAGMRARADSLPFEHALGIFKSITRI